MSQTVSSAFAAQSSADSKALDYALVIAGWPTVYTVAKGSYSLTGQLGNFTSIQPWASIPSASAAAPRGRPEEGEMTVGLTEVTVLDRRINGIRRISDLLSRQSYVQGSSPAAITSLTANIDNGYTGSGSGVIPVASTAGFNQQSGTIYVGLECIRYTGATAISFTGCTSANRGYLLTSPTPHLVGASVYSVMPSLYRRRAFLYKGFQNLTLDQWAPAFGGVIVGATKEGPAVTLSVASTSWNTYADGTQVLFGGSRFTSDPPIFGSLQLSSNGMKSGDVLTRINLAAPESITYWRNLASGRYLMNLAGEWMAIQQIFPMLNGQPGGF